MKDLQELSDFFVKANSSAFEEKIFSFGKCVDVEKNGRYNKTRRR